MRRITTPGLASSHTSSGSLACAAVLCLVLLLAVSAPAAQTPAPQAVLDGMLEAAGGADAFHQLGLLKLQYTNEETTRDGTPSKVSFTGFASTIDLQSLRVEMPGDIVVVKNGEGGWATMKGKVDTRPQTPTMARTTTHFHLLPLMFPFSLTMDGLQLSDVEPGTFEGEPVWRMTLTFPSRFFNNPVMDVPWTVYASKKDGSFVAAEYVPPSDYAKIAVEGMRFRYTKLQTVNGVRLPSQALLEALDIHGVPSAHVSIVNLEVSSEAWDSTIFIDPDTLESMDDEIALPGLEE
jgi:hypothetical protein